MAPPSGLPAGRGHAADARDAAASILQRAGPDGATPAPSRHAQQPMAPAPRLPRVRWNSPASRAPGPSVRLRPEPQATTSAASSSRNKPTSAAPPSLTAPRLLTSPAAYKPNQPPLHIDLPRPRMSRRPAQPQPSGTSSRHHETVEMQAILTRTPSDWFRSEALASAAPAARADDPFVSVYDEQADQTAVDEDPHDQGSSPVARSYPSPKPPPGVLWDAQRDVRATDGSRISRHRSRRRDHIDIFLGEIDGMPDDPEEDTEDETVPAPRASLGGKFKSALTAGRTGYGFPTDQQAQEGESAAWTAHGPSRAGGQSKSKRRWSASYGPTNRKNLPPYPPSASANSSRQSKYERQASVLLRKFNPAPFHASSSSTTVPSPPTPAGASVESEAPVRSGEPSRRVAGHPPPGGSVLASLLMLYEKERMQGHHGPEESATSLSRATPSKMTEETSDFVSHSEEIERRPTGPLPGRPSSAPRTPVFACSNVDEDGGEARAAPFQSLIGRGLSALRVGPDALEMIERPAAARSGAGVFGALVASTGSLIGSVSPLHSTLGAAPNRPGFTLDRYVLPEMNACTLQYTRQLLAESEAGAHPIPAPSTGGRDSSSAMGEYPMLKHAASFAGLSTPGGSSYGGLHFPNSTPSQWTLTTPEGINKDYYHGSESVASSPHNLLLSGRSSMSTSPAWMSQPPFTRRSEETLGSLSADPSHIDSGNPFASPGASTAFAAPGSARVSADYFGLPPPGSRAPTIAPTSSVAFGSELGSREDEHDARRAWRKKVKKRRHMMRRERIYITQHVAAVLERQDFLLKLARCLLMFGAPPHRIDAQILKSARMLDMNCQCVFLPQMLLMSFQDSYTHTSEQHIIKQAPTLDMVKLNAMHDVYVSVITDRIGVQEGSTQLDELMRCPPHLGRLKLILVGALCSTSITPGPMGFSGSFIDALLAGLLGAFVVATQLFIKTDSTMGTELLVAGVNSFITAALFQNGHGYFCSSAALGGSIVLILPSLTYLFASLETQSRRNLVPGAIRMASGVLHSLFLGFGMSLGAAVWTLCSSHPVNLPPEMANCSALQNRPGQPWYRAGVGSWWAFLTVPLFTTGLALRNQARLRTWEFPVSLAIAIAGWCVSHFTALRPLLSNRTDLLAMFGSLTVAVFGNVYGHFANGHAFTVSVPGMLYQLPNGMAKGQGLLLFAQTNDTTTTQNTFSNGFRVAENLVTTAVGMAVGLFLASLLTYILLPASPRSGRSRAHASAFFAF